MGGSFPASWATTSYFFSTASDRCRALFFRVPGHDLHVPPNAVLPTSEAYPLIHWSRAAAVACGVLEVLDKGGLARKIAPRSSRTGGSVTAAAYAIAGEERAGATPLSGGPRATSTRTACFKSCGRRR